MCLLQILRQVLLALSVEQRGRLLARVPEKAREQAHSDSGFIFFSLKNWYSLVQASIVLCQDIPRFSASSSFLLIGSLSVMSSSNLTQASLSPKRTLFIYFYLILFIQTSERKKSLTGSPGADDFRASDPFIRSHSLLVAALGFPVCCAIFRLAVPGLGAMQPAAPGS